MKTINTSSAQEVVLEWLKAELSSARFGGDLNAALKKYSCDEKIITNADLTDANENKTRWLILKSYRTWLDRNFDDYEWKLVELDYKDVYNLNYIDYSYWNELSDNTHKVGKASENIAKGMIVFDELNDRFYSVAENVDIGTDLPPIIVVSNHGNNQGEILEGHLRATGYALSRTKKRPLIAIWGKLRKKTI